MDVNEFRTTWNSEGFKKNRSMVIAARRVTRKSVTIVQMRACRQLKYVENDLVKELKAVQREREMLKCSLAENLQQRLKALQTEMENYQDQMKTRLQQEKNYWKELEEIIAKRTNSRRPLRNKISSSNPPVLTKATFVRHIDQNNENLPPIESTSPVKVPKIRKKNK